MAAHVLLFGANQPQPHWFAPFSEPVCPDEYLCAEEEGAAMRKLRIFRIFAVVGLAAVACGTSVAAQESRGTPEQQMACTPDVFRLCGAAIPDANRIVACLRSNTLVLSAPCRAVFESSDSAANPPPPGQPQAVAPPVRRYQYQ
jgi:hypothetical protein